MKITIKSATPLSKEIVQKIENRYKGREVEYEYAIDKELLGGFVMFEEDMLYDGSLKTRRTRIKEKLVRTNMSDDSVPFITRLRQEIESYINTPTEHVVVGIVLSNADGVINISGISTAQYGELLYIEGGFYALVFNLEKDSVGALLFSDPETVSRGCLVYTTGRVVEVPTGEELLGRVINPLGVPLDNLGDINTKHFRAVESPAPIIMDRGKVNTPLATGIMAIDSMVPIGRGQRELIIGDRSTGKTAIAIDAIINQKDKNVVCIYVAIGQKATGVARIVHTLKEHGAMDNTIVLCSTANDSSPMQFIAPYAGCAIAEEFMLQGRDVLIVYDDLSKHAVAYRAISLLLKRPPGREAYPGDIFYLHSRLLERAAKLSEAKGGGSITALPIIETQAGDITAYIPTNVISITDGQLYLESELFNSGQRPAVNVGLSVSRVGGSAQIKAMRKVSGKLRLELAQYRELAIFTQFGSDIDSSTAEVLNRGKRLLEALKQPQYSPIPQAEQVVRLKALSSKALASININMLVEFMNEFISMFGLQHKDVVSEIEVTGDLTMTSSDIIESGVQKFVEEYLSRNA